MELSPSEKLTVAQLVKKFPALHGIRRSIIMLETLAAGLHYQSSESSLYSTIIFIFRAHQTLISVHVLRSVTT
jgi:hypothetical protein